MLPLLPSTNSDLVQTQPAKREQSQPRSMGPYSERVSRSGSKKVSIENSKVKENVDFGQVHIYMSEDYKAKYLTINSKMNMTSMNTTQSQI